jgi:hypothetical protein
LMLRKNANGANAATIPPEARCSSCQDGFGEACFDRMTYAQELRDDRRGRLRCPTPSRGD